MKGEEKNLKYISKKILSKKILKKIKEIKNFNEKNILLKHSIKSYFDLKFKDIESKIKGFEKENKEIFFISIKANLLKFKIKYFIVNYDRKEFIKVQKLVKEIEKELNKL